MRIGLWRERQALGRLADGAADEAVALLREATALEDGMSVEFGPPAVVKPSRELLGEVLLELGRASDAAREFRRALELTPGRPFALRGLLARRPRLATARRPGRQRHNSRQRGTRSTGDEVRQRLDPGVSVRQHAATGAQMRLAR